MRESQQFEVSEQRRMPVDNVGTDAIATITEPSAIQLYYYNSGTLTSDAGQAAGVVVVGKLTYRNIKNALGDVTGTDQDTSLAFTSTALTTLRAFPYTKCEAVDMNSGTVKAAAITKGFANGEYCIDHRTGTVYGVKADTSTTLTSVSYKVETSTSGSGGGGVAAEVKITDGTDTADVLARTTGTEQPAVTDDALVVYDVGGGAASVASQYRATSSGQDGTAVYLSATTLTVSGTPFTVASEDLVYIREVDATGNTANILVNGTGGVHMEISGTTLTKTGGTDFSANGVYELGYNGQDKAYDAASAANRGFETSPLDSHYVNGAIDVDTTNVGAGPTYYPSSTGFSMDTKKSLSFSGKIVEGDAELNTLTVEVMNDEDTTSGDWQTVYFFDNISNSWVNSYTCNATTTQMMASMGNLNARYVRFAFVGGASATNTLIIKGRTVSI